MLVAAFSWGDLWELALAVFLFAVGISLAYFFVRLAGTAAEVSAFIRGAGDSMLPVIGKVGGSVDRVNGQLDKVDRITDSAVDAADSVDTAVRAVSLAITRPVQKVSGFAAGAWAWTRWGSSGEGRSVSVAAASAINKGARNVP